MKKKTAALLLAAAMVTVPSAAEEGCGVQPAPSGWAAEYIAKAENITKDLNPRWRSAVSRETFCEMTYNMMDGAAEIDWKKASPTPLSDVKNEKIDALRLEGIVEGKAEGIFAPEDSLTREEAAIILDRAAQRLNLSEKPQKEAFADEEEISDKAKDAVKRMCALGVMCGVGEGRFDPKGEYTAEQAAATLVRLLEAVPKQAEAETFADKLSANMPDDRNYMFSPLSVKTALLTAAEGAGGETRGEILDALNVTDADEYGKSLKLMLENYSKSDLLKLGSANSIWVNTDKTTQKFSEEYKAKVKEAFGAEAAEVTDKTAASAINGWVNEKTAGKISSIVDENNADFWAMLVNAVYFKGRWLSQFSESATEKDIFTSRGGKETSIDFMNKTAWIRCARENGVDIAELPYLTREAVTGEDGEYIETKKLEGVDVSMYLMMSDNDFNPEQTLANAKFSSSYTALGVPKFKIEYAADLRDILKKTGINRAFLETAEFEGMFNKGNMQITDVMHKTYITVDEKGTEAAAVTGIGMAGTSLPPEPVELRFNKPFTFVIKDNIGGEVLFMGEYAFAE